MSDKAGRSSGPPQQAYRAGSLENLGPLIHRDSQRADALRCPQNEPPPTSDFGDRPSRGRLCLFNAAT